MGTFNRWPNKQLRDLSPIRTIGQTQLKQEKELWGNKETNIIKMLKKRGITYQSTKRDADAAIKNCK